MGWRVVHTLMNFLDKRFVALRQRYANVLAGDLFENIRSNDNIINQDSYKNHHDDNNVTFPCSGTSHPIPRWRLCVTLVNLNLGMVTGAMFVNSHYSAFMKASV